MRVFDQPWDRDEFVIFFGWFKVAEHSFQEPMPNSP